MTDHGTKAEKLANNAVLTLIARGAMVIACAALVPAGVGLLDMRTDIRLLRADMLSSIKDVDQRTAARILALEDRQGAQSRRMDITDQRIERLADITGKFAVDTAVLAEQIKALIAANQRVPPSSR